MLRLALILALLCVALTPPPLPKRPHKSAAVNQGAGALALISQPKVATVKTNSVTFVWQYPAGVNPSNLWWSVMSSTDLRNWTVAISNASGNSTVTVQRIEPIRVYRLSGRNTP